MALVEKTAVILFNLGGPDNPAAIRPFLFNFFMDKNIIRLPLPFRFVFAALMSWRRAQNEAGENYALLGGKSPLLENTRAQAAALEKILGPHYRVFTCMRYWHPMAGEVAAQVKFFLPDRIVLLPLYPQYSTTTTRSAFQAWDRAAREAGLSAPTRRIESYHLDEGFIGGSAALVKKEWGRAKKETGKTPRLLFSAHGLPESIVRAGDPYQRQCEESARAIAAAAGIADGDWLVCYQSRVGPMKWIEPSTEEEIRRAGRDNVPVVIYPHSFTQEHVETLVELDIEYRETADRCGVPGFYRAETAGTNPAFIAGLAALVKNAPDRPEVADQPRAVNG